MLLAEILIIIGTIYSAGTARGEIGVGKDASEMEFVRRSLDSLWSRELNFRVTIDSVAQRNMDRAGVMTSKSFTNTRLITVFDQFGKSKRMDSGADASVGQVVELISQPAMSISRDSKRDELFSHETIDENYFRRQCGGVCGYFAGLAQPLSELTNSGTWNLQSTDGVGGQRTIEAIGSGVLGTSTVNMLLRSDAQNEIAIDSIQIDSSQQNDTEVSFIYTDFKYEVTDDGWRYISGYKYTSIARFEADLEQCCNTVVATETVTAMTTTPPVTLDEIQLDAAPVDGTRVIDLDNEWRHLEWRDGRVAEIVDPEKLRKLGAVVFSEPRSKSAVWISFAALICLVAVMWFAMRRPSTKLVIIAVVCCDTTLAGQKVASEAVSDTFSESARGFHFEEPYCGAASVFAVLSHFGVKVSFSDLSSRDFIAGWEGSTGEQLQAALKKYGVESSAFHGGNPSSLTACTGPVILHTRSRTSPLFRHWVVYLGAEKDETLRILDPAIGSVRMTAAELQSQWNGVVIIPKKSLKNFTEFQLATITEFIPFLIIAMCFGLLFSCKRTASSVQSVSWFQCCVKQCSLLLLCAGVFGLITFCGITGSDAAIGTIAGLHPGEFLREVQKGDLIRRNTDAPTNTHLIDCRFSRDFKRGSIPGAINVPVDATATDESEALHGVSKSDFLVLFCQSDNCSYAELVARRLIGRGYRNLGHYAGGYREWKILETEHEETLRGIFK